MENSKGAHITIRVGNLPAGRTYKELKSHAQHHGTAPQWAVVYSSNEGAIGFAAPLEAKIAFEVLSGSLFQGKHAIACSMNTDRRYSKARACRHGAQCRGTGTY